MPDARTLLGQCSLNRRKVKSRAVNTDRKEQATAKILVTCRVNELSKLPWVIGNQSSISGMIPDASQLVHTGRSAGASMNYAILRFSLDDCIIITLHFQTT